MPTYVDILGFCAWGDKPSEGVTRAEATGLLGTLRNLLDPALRPHIPEFQLKGSRNYSIRIPITPSYVEEIKNIWRDFLSQESNKFKNNVQLRARAQPPPELQQRWVIFGKAGDWASSKFQQFEPRPFWAPDYTVFVTQEGDMGAKQSIELCSISEGGVINWNEAGTKLVGIVSPAKATEEIKKFVNI